MLMNIESAEMLKKICSEPPPYLCPRCKTPMKKQKWSFTVEDKYGLYCPKCKFKIGGGAGNELAKKI